MAFGRGSHVEITGLLAASQKAPAIARNSPYTRFFWFSGDSHHINCMIYLLAIFCSPLALLLTGKPISALFNLILYVLSIAFWITIILHSLGFLLWGIAVLHATLTINNAREERRARRIVAATKQN